MDEQGSTSPMPTTQPMSQPRMQPTAPPQSQPMVGLDVVDPTVIDPTVVEAETRLRVTYSLHRASQPRSGRWVVLHHGICHTREQFAGLIQALNDAGLHVAMIDQQSEGASWRNWISMGQYRRGFAAALAKIGADHRDFEVGCYVLHSMGAFLGEAAQQLSPELRRPTVLMTPIPAWIGALATSVRLAVNYPLAYLRAVVRQDILSLGDDWQRCKEMFFAPESPATIVDGVFGRLKHAPFLAYLQLALPVFTQPLVLRDDGNRRLLLTSKDDGIFSLWEYWGTRRRYSRLTEIRFRGGHDFFMEHAAGVAALVAAFLQDEPERERTVRIDPAHAQTAGPRARTARAVWRGRTKRRGRDRAGQKRSPK